MVSAVALALFNFASPLVGEASLLAQDVQGIQAVPAVIRPHNPPDLLRQPLPRQPMVEDALRSFGYRPELLTRAEERALENTYFELFPDADPRRTRLNRSQATALVYIALVHSNRRDTSSPWRGRQSCEVAARRVYELEDFFTIPGRGQPRYLRRIEQEPLLEEAREIQRLARSCGEYELVDHASDLVSLVSRHRAERELVARQVDRMKAVVRVAFGR